VVGAHCASADFEFFWRHLSSGEGHCIEWLTRGCPMGVRRWEVARAKADRHEGERELSSRRVRLMFAAEGRHVCA
jgi:hypothetical protein